MSAFLQQVAHAILEAHGGELREVAVVLPSQRAGLYLRKWIAEEAGKPLWSPQVFTIGSFTETLSGLRPLAPEELLFEAYEAYRHMEGDRAQDLGDFLQWAGPVLADISEADAHLVPLESYYRDLRSWEEIEWTFNDNPLSAGQQRMVRFWSMVGKMHTALNSRLLEQGAGTVGLLERTAAARAATGTHPWKAVWFAGLNALTPAQESVVRHLRASGHARLAWDADRYYLDRPEQEAGMHLRKAIATFGAGIIPPGNNLVEGDLQLRTVRAPNDAAQAWCAAEFLTSVSAEERARTAVVLADESLLQPLLEALPSDIGPLNVTMGLPVSRLPVGSFLDALHRLHAGMRPGAGFFHADVERFLGHPFLGQGATAAAVKQLLAEVRGRQRAFITSEAMLEAASGAGLFSEADAVFIEVKDVRAEMPALTAHALSWAMHATQGDPLASEQVYQASVTLKRIHLLLARYAHQLDLKTYAALFSRLLGTARIGLFGEPLAGVQVMGMLEARALDLERVIVLGAQEGSLPSTGAQRSYIPFELRKAHGMPLREGNDAVQAYNFLRMLQRAKQAILIWPEGAEPTGPSRFMLQLEHELMKEKGVGMTGFDARIRMPRSEPAQVSLGKDHAVLQALRGKLEAGLSPSALGDWLSCPADFHFKYVLRMKESEGVDARIAPNVLGDALHAAMQAIYTPLIGKPLQAEPLLEAAGNMEGLITERLEQVMGAEQLRSGQPLLQLRMAAEAARRFLRHEAAMAGKNAVITPLELEVPLSHLATTASEAIGSPVRIKGRLDRVDRLNGQVRILDLKSGRVDPRDLVLREMTVEAMGGSKRFAAQLLIYAWLYLQEHPELEAVQAGILPLQRAASSEPLLLGLPSGTLITRAELPAIGSLITEAVSRMMDVALPIAHEPKSRYCVFCLAQ